MNHDCPGLVLVELERRQEIHLFDRFNEPAGVQTQRRFRKCLDAHDAGQYGDAINLMVVEERLQLGIQCGLHREAAIDANSGDFADHWTLKLAGSGQCRHVQPSRGVPLIQQTAETLCDEDFAGPVSSGQFAADHRDGGVRRQHVDARQIHHLGNGTARGHSDATPRRPVNHDAARLRPSGAEA